MSHHHLRARAGALIAAIIVPLVVLAPPLASASDPLAVTNVVRTDTPRVLDGEVNDFAGLGDTIVVGGTFTQVYDHATGQVHDRRGILAFSRATGALLPFDPDLNGSVHELETSQDGSHVFAAGTFTQAGGQWYQRVVKLDVGGNVDAAFHTVVSAKVDGLAVANGRVYLGGAFNTVEGVSREGLAAVDAVTGALDATFDLPVTGIGGNNSKAVRALDVTPDGARLLVVHAGLNVGPEYRPGIALIALDTAAAAVTGWRSTIVEDNRCKGALRYKDGEISPDGTYFVVVSQGGDIMPVCDSALRFPIADVEVEVDWISRHFDSLLSVAISDTAVYTSGHFWGQESPGSPDPFPGEATKKYGCHGDGPDNCAWVVLGDDVTRRDQLGALDPDTGKTRDWDPGINAHEGGFGLEIVDGALLVGHDRDRMDGQLVGRFGMFDDDWTGQQPPDTTKPTGLISEPVEGQVLEPGRIRFAGTAADNNVVTSGWIGVRNKGTGLWLQDDETWGPWTLIEVNLADQGLPSTTWLRRPYLWDEGEYLVNLRVRDAAGNQSDAVRVDFTITEPGGAPDTTPPGLPVIATPADHEVVDAGPVLIQGGASDDVGVTEVRVSVRDDVTLQWLQPDGTWGSWTWILATLASPGQPATQWDLGVDLPAGPYRVNVRARDAASNQSGATSHSFDAS